MVGAFLRLVLWAFIAYVAFLFVRIFFGPKRERRQARREAPRGVQGIMVKDEVCGTYLPREEALTEVRDGVERYFCSEECRRKLEAR
jgi:YHS domain-containing protein